MIEREDAAYGVYHAAVTEYERTGKHNRIYQGPLEDLLGTPWTVIGVTREALERFHEIGYKYQPGSGIQRCHLKHRVETFRMALENKFKSIHDVKQFFSQHSHTVLGYKQNGTTPPTEWYDVNDRTLFTPTNCGFNWRVKQEVEFLMDLYRKELS